MAATVLFGDNLDAKRVQAEFYFQYIDGLEIRYVMGDMFSPIHVLDRMGKGDGDNVYVSLLQALNPFSFSVGMQQAVGNSESQVAQSQQVVLNQIRKSARQEGVSLTAQRSPLPFFDVLRPQLLDCVQQMLRNDILNTAQYALGGASPIQDRALFGNSTAEANYNTTFNTALSTIDATSDKLTVAHIRLLKLKAEMGGTFGNILLNARKVRPMKVEMQNGMKSEFYIMWCDPAAAADLKTDTTWTSLATQGKFEFNAPSLVNVGDFLGMVDNVLVYQFAPMVNLRYPTAGNGGTPVAHNLFLGAQAFALVYGLQSTFYDEWFDFQNIYEVCHSEIRGQVMLKFNQLINGTTVAVENGLIHSFTTASNFSV